mgnify:FL=1
MKKKRLLLLWKIAVILLVNILVVLAVAQPALPALSRRGSRGEEVKQIQTVLKDRELYEGNIDGIYGSQTEKAVIQFQKQMGLTPDGIVGPKTLSAMGLGDVPSGVTGIGRYSANEVALLARIISAESRGEPYAGQVAVGAVILNRVAHPSFPNTLAGVIYQPGAFSCLDDGGVNAAVADSAYRAARDAINGSDPSGGALYYYNPAKATSQWIFSRPIITVIGQHRFCS